MIVARPIWRMVATAAGAVLFIISISSQLHCQFSFWGVSASSPPLPNNVHLTTAVKSSDAATPTVLREENIDGGSSNPIAIDNTSNEDTNSAELPQQQQPSDGISDAASALAYNNYMNPMNYNNNNMNTMNYQQQPQQQSAPPSKPIDPRWTDMGSSSRANNANNAGSQTQQQQTTTGWFGKFLGKDKQTSNNNNDDGSNNKSTTLSSARGFHAANTFLPPPPPPPPLMNGQETAKDEGSKVGASSTSHQSSTTSTWNSQQPPPQQQYYANTYNSNPNNQQYIDPNTYQALLYDLDESTLREMTLTHQIQNLTSHLNLLTTESELLVSRADVITERLADSEANFHYVHNRNLELDANCTELQTAIDSLRSDIAEHESTSSKLNEEKSKDEGIIQELRTELRKVTSELEQLACLVETTRFEDESTTYLHELDKKQRKKGGKSKKHKKKKKSFWAWLFGWDYNNNSSSDSSHIVDEEDLLPEEERRRAAQELSRTTLLHALQTERTNVYELESALAVLQRNNSAIMDVVSSRDELISELNDRVAVFEEDKMVLKAALRQLQMEIKEEAPKTQQLIDDLEKARDVEVALREEMEQSMHDHEEEMDELEYKLDEMTQEQNKTNSELELIGLYVDQLEDRLANYALAKKELDLLEKQCETLEAQSKEYAKEVEMYKCQLLDLSKEQNETKPLLEDLIKERELSRLKVQELTRQVNNLNEQINVWKQRLSDAERKSEEIKGASARQLFLKVEEERRGWEETAQQSADEKEGEFKKILTRERSAWEQSANEEFVGRLQNEKSTLEQSLVNDWSARLEAQRAEMEHQYHQEQQDVQNKMNEDRKFWEEAKEQEFNKRLLEEKSVWESSLPSPPVVETPPSLSFEDQVEKAAEKIYKQLEASGAMFGDAEPSLDQLKDVMGIVNNDDMGVDDETEEPETDSVGVDDTLQPESDSAGEESDNDDQAGGSVSPPQREEEEATKTQGIPPSQNRRQIERSVPLRSMRKAFSRATGIHGVMAPSSVQLRQQKVRKRHQQQQQQQQNRRDDIKLDNMATSDATTPLADDDETDDAWEEYDSEEEEEMARNHQQSSQAQSSLSPPPLPEDR